MWICVFTVTLTVSFKKATIDCQDRTSVSVRLKVSIKVFVIWAFVEWSQFLTLGECYCSFTINTYLSDGVSPMIGASVDCTKSWTLTRGKCYCVLLCTVLKSWTLARGKCYCQCQCGDDRSFQQKVSTLASFYFFPASNNASRRSKDGTKIRREKNGTTWININLNLLVSWCDKTMVMDYHSISFDHWKRPLGAIAQCLPNQKTLKLIAKYMYFQLWTPYI